MDRLASTEDRQLNQLHPGVYSSINSKDAVYNIADGVVTLMAIDTFERGKDGVLQYVSSPEEFKFLYGEPNYDRYGQQGYNIINWLNAGGSAYVMRIAADDATYAHAIVNVQTKVVKGNSSTHTGKKVHLDDTNEDVYVDDVYLRPTASFVKKNNINKDVLLGELSKLRVSENTVDGYSNNFLFMVYPEGRGESYNDLAFRIYTNETFENIQNSRVYNFEVIRYDADGNQTMIEGPFYVSFDDEALDGNGESMFIEDVVNRYSKYLKVKFNKDAYINIAKIINPDVNPNKLDILTGKTIYNLENKPETYYNSITRQEEDIHLSLQKYNSNGHPVSKNGNILLNTPNVEDPVEEALISLDNSMRELNYTTEINKVSYMKKDFPSLKDNEFSSFKLNLNRLITPAGKGTSDRDEGEIVRFIEKHLNPDTEDSEYHLYNEYKKNYEKVAENYHPGADSYKDNEVDTALAPYINMANQIVSLIRSDLLDYGNQVSAMYELVKHGITNITLAENYSVSSQEIQDLLTRRDKVQIFTVQHKSKITNIINNVSDYRLGLFQGSDLEGMGELLNNLEDEIRYAWASLVPAAFDDSSKAPQDIRDTFDATKPESAVSKYNDILQLYEDMNNGYIVDEENNPVNKNKIYSTITEVANTLLDVIRKITFQSTVTIIDDVIVKVKNDYFNCMKEFYNAIMDAIKLQATYDADAVRQTARQNIDVAVNSIVATNSKFFNSRLLDFTSPVKLLLGSDGNFEYDVNNLKARKTAIKNKMIKAYNGSILAEITDTHLYPADVILDARYPNEVKIAISNFVRQRRKDMQFFADDSSNNFTVSPQDALTWRQTQFNVVSEYVSAFTQSLTYYDEYTGRDLRFTTTYALATKIPSIATQYGLHYPLAGPRRGIIDGMSAVSWFPNDSYKEKLYAAHLNYLQYDNNLTTLGSQSTTKTGAGALTQINNMFTLLKIKRGAEQLCANFIFEFNDTQTTDALYTALNNYLSQYKSNRACEAIDAAISASDYDKQQRILRVRITIKFTGVIERIALDFDVS